MTFNFTTPSSVQLLYVTDPNKLSAFGHVQQHNHQQPVVVQENLLQPHAVNFVQVPQPMVISDNNNNFGRINLLKNSQVMQPIQQQVQPVNFVQPTYIVNNSFMNSQNVVSYNNINLSNVINSIVELAQNGHTETKSGSKCF